MEPLCARLLRIAGNEPGPEAFMLDLILLAFGLGIFTLLAAYAAGCERV
jgi:hypothetical protein